MKTFVIILSLLMLGGLAHPVIGQQKMDTTAVLAGNNIYYRFMGSILEKSTDGAKTWKHIKTPKVTAFNNSGMLPFFIAHNMQWMDENNGYLFGDDGTFNYAAVILRTFDGGKSWHKFYAEGISQSGMYLKEIQTIDDKHHFAMLGVTDDWSGKKESVRGIHYVYSSNGGKSWKMNVLEIPKDIHYKKGPKAELKANGTGIIQHELGKWETKDFGKTWTKAEDASY